MTPQNGDEIEVYALSLQNANLVKISGNVLIPGEKELPKDGKLSTLLNLIRNTNFPDLVYCTNLIGE